MFMSIHCPLVVTSKNCNVFRQDQWSIHVNADMTACYHFRLILLKYSHLFEKFRKDQEMIVLQRNEWRLWFHTFGGSNTDTYTDKLFKNVNKRKSISAAYYVISKSPKWQNRLHHSQATIQFFAVVATWWKCAHLQMLLWESLVANRVYCLDLTVHRPSSKVTIYGNMFWSQLSLA